MASRWPLPLLGITALLSCSDSTPRLAELTATSLAIAPTAIAVGTSGTVSFALRNLGVGDAGAFSYEVRLLGSGGAPIVLAQRPVTGLGRGQAKTEAFQVTIPPGTTPGTYQLQLVLDPDNRITEAVEDNNTIDLPAPVTVLAAGSDVNLEVTNASLSVSTVLPDDIVTVSYTVTNRGTSPVLTETTTQFYLSLDTQFSPDDRKVGQHQVGAIIEGRSTQLASQISIPSDVPAADYFVLVVVDGGRVLAETNENDNVANTPLRVEGGNVNGIDIVVTALTITPTSVPRGGGITVSFTIKNRGNTPAGSFFNQIRLGSGVSPAPSLPPLDTINVSTLNAGEEVSYQRSVVIPASVPPGGYFIRVLADASNIVTETNDENNIRSDASGLQVTPPTTTDVLAENVTLSGVSNEMVAAGESIKVNFDIGNNGPQPSGSITANVILVTDTTNPGASRVLSTIPIVNLEPSETRSFSPTVTIPGDLDNRRHFVGVVVDPDLRLQDSNRANNTSFETNGFTVTGGAGCTDDSQEPNDSRATPRPISPGSVVDLALCSRNEDWYSVNVLAGSSIRVRMTSADPSRPDLDLELFAPNLSDPIDRSARGAANEDVAADFVSTSGDYLIRVFGPGGSSGSYRLDVQVVPAGGDGVDLVPLTPTFTPTGADAGQNITITYEVRNVGTQTSSDFSNELTLLPADGSCPNPITLGTFATSPLPPGQARVITESVTIPTGSCNGDYFVQVAVDPSLAVAETFDSNNIRTSTAKFTIGGVNGCVDDAFEQNDNRLQAKPIAPGATDPLKICRGDEDWYSISLSAGERLDVAISFVNSDGDLDLSLYNASGQLLGASASTTTNIERVTYTAATPETVFIQVIGFFDVNQFGNRYSMTISGGSAVDLSVRDLTVSPLVQETGRDIRVTFTVENLLSQASGATTADIILRSGGSDTNVQSVAVDSLGGGGASSQSFDVKFTLPTLTPGTYEVRVVVDPAGTIGEAREDNNTASNPGLRVVGPCTPDAQEPNDNSLQPTDVTPSGSPVVIQDLSICLGDSDWFEVVVPGGATHNLTASISFSHSAGDLDMVLYRLENNASLTEVVRGGGSTDGEVVSVSGVTDAIFLFEVFGFGSAINTYNLTVTLGQ